MLVLSTFLILIRSIPALFKKKIISVFNSALTMQTTQQQKIYLQSYLHLKRPFDVCICIHKVLQFPLKDQLNKLTKSDSSDQRNS